MLQSISFVCTLKKDRNFKNFCLFHYLFLFFNVKVVPAKASPVKTNEQLDIDVLANELLFLAFSIIGFFLLFYIKLHIWKNDLF